MGTETYIPANAPLVAGQADITPAPEAYDTSK